MILSADFLLLLIAACVAAPHTLRVGRSARVSILPVFVVAAVALHGTREAVLVAGTGALYGLALSRPILRLRLNLVLAASTMMSAWVAGFVFTSTGGLPGDVRSAQSLTALLCAVLTFFVLDTGLASLAAGLARGINPLRHWLRRNLWTLNAHLAGGVLVVLFGTVRDALGVQALFLTVPMVVLVYHLIRAHDARARGRSSQS